MTPGYTSRKEFLREIEMAEDRLEIALMAAREDFALAFVSSSPA